MKRYSFKDIVQAKRLSDGVGDHERVKQENNMGYKHLALAGCLLMLGGCQQIFSAIQSFRQCENTAVKQRFDVSLRQAIANISPTKLKALIEEEDIIIDSQKMLQLMQSIRFELRDIDKLSSGEGLSVSECQAELIVTIPSQMIADADIARAIHKESNVLQSAYLSQLIIENNQLKNPVRYQVRYAPELRQNDVELLQSLKLVGFMQSLLIDALLKQPRLQSLQQQKQQQLQLQADQQALEHAYQQVLVEEAQYKLNKANLLMDRLWHKAPAVVQNKLVTEQQIWLKKRQLECQLNSKGADIPEVFRLNCENNMTLARVSELGQQINELSH